MKKLFFILTFVSVSSFTFASTNNSIKEDKQNQNSEKSECCKEGRSDADGDFVTVESCRAKRKDACSAARLKLDRLVPTE